MIPQELKAHRYTELDSLRGLAAGTVVLHHFCLIWVGAHWFAVVDQSPLHVLIAGREAVVLFFILSGFVLSIPFSGRKPPSYSKFLVKRFCRIYLPFAAAVIIAGLCTIKFHSSVKTGNPWMDKTWIAAPTLHSILWALLGKPAYTRPLNVALWTLILEMRASILFPALLWVAKKVPPAGTLTTPALLCLLWPTLFHHRYELALSLIYVSGLFLAGIVLHHNLASLSAWFKRYSNAQHRLLFALSLILFEMPNMLMRDFTEKYPINLEYFRDYVIGIGAVGIIVCVIQSERCRIILRNPILLRLGSLSYSTYLMHGTILFLLIRLWLGKIQPVALFAIYLVSVYIASELFHVLIDQRAVALGRRVSQVWPNPSPRSDALLQYGRRTLKGAVATNYGDVPPESSAI